VPVLRLGTAERMTALVEMKDPGVWVLGDPMDEDRRRGMGIVAEYPGAKGEPIRRSRSPSVGIIGVSRRRAL
jgi:hypothetical protein